MLPARRPGSLGRSWEYWRWTSRIAMITARFRRAATGRTGAAAGGGGGPIRVKPWQGGLLRGRLIQAMTARPIPG